MAFSGSCGSLDKANRASMFEYQTPATLTQAAAVQNTWYTLLDTTANVRVYMIGAAITVANETLECRVTIDGETIAAEGLAATAATDYYFIPTINSTTALDLMHGFPVTNEQLMRAFILEGRSVKIELRKTTATGGGTLIGIAVYGVLTSA